MTHRLARPLSAALHRVGPVCAGLLNSGLLRAGLVCAGFAATPFVAPSAALGATSLPGGASSLRETYQDWQVGCATRGTGVQCSLSQQQAQKGGQRVLAIELVALGPDQARGTLVLPFGLDLAKGVTLQIDDAAAGAPLPFRTCLPAGCLVALGFDKPTVAKLRRGKQLGVQATAVNGKAVTLAVSLKGFSNAMDRAADLTK